MLLKSHDGQTPQKGSILIVLHQQSSSSGRVGQILVQRGFVLDIRRPALGDPLPQTLKDYAGAIVFGGPMSANDSDDFVRDEIDWMRVPLTENRPFLGICLGAQMLVKHLGGTVVEAPGAMTEIGWYPITPTKEGLEILDWPSVVYHFHTEGFDLPKDATLLAAGDVYPNQAFRYGENAWGVQFHAELTRMMMHSWVVRGADRFLLPNAQAGVDHLDGRMLYDMALRRWLEKFLQIIFEREQPNAQER